VIAATSALSLLLYVLLSNGLHNHFALLVDELQRLLRFLGVER
jgi:hypothetical protein